MFVVHSDGPSNPFSILIGTPVRRSDTSVVAAPDPEPSQPAPDPEPSQPAPDPQSSQPTTPAPVTITRRGVIQVVGGNAGSIGYISSNSPAYLSSGTDVQKALVVTFDAYQTGITSNININLEVRFRFRLNVKDFFSPAPLTFRAGPQDSLSWAWFRVF